MASRHTSREIAQMRLAKVSEQRRVSTAAEFLGPRRVLEVKNAWMERDALLSDRFVDDRETAEREAERKMRLDARRARVQALYAGEFTEWSAELAPAVEAARRGEDRERRYADLVEARTKVEAKEKGDAARRAELRRFGESAAFAQARRLRDEAHIDEGRAAEVAAVREKQMIEARREASTAYKPSPFAAAELRGREVRCSVGFDTDGASVLASADRRRLFAAALIAQLDAKVPSSTVVPTIVKVLDGLSVEYAEGRADLVARLRLRWESESESSEEAGDAALDTAVDALRSLIESGGLVARQRRAIWFAVEDEGVRVKSKKAAMEAYRADLDAAVEDNRERRAVEAAEERAWEDRIEAMPSFLKTLDADAAKERADLEERRRRAEALRGQLEADAELARRSRSDAAAAERAAERVLLEKAALEAAAEDAEAAHRRRLEAEAAQAHYARVKAQAERDALAAERAERDFEANERWRFWDQRDNAERQREAASTRLRADVHEAWAQQLATPRTPGGGRSFPVEEGTDDDDDAAAAAAAAALVRAEVWALQQRRDAAETYARENRDIGAQKRASDRADRQRTVAWDQDQVARQNADDAWLRDHAPAVPAHLQHRLPAELRAAPAPGTPSHSQLQRHLHYNFAAGRPRSAAAVLGAANRQGRERATRQAW